MIGIAVHEGQRDEHEECNDPAGSLPAHERLASRPAGRMNIMTMKKAKAST